jgi:hypothetical protein
VFRGTNPNALADYFTGPSLAVTGQSETQDSAHFNADSAIVLSPFSSPGVLPPDNTTAVHWGFLRAFNSVADIVISIMEEQFTFYPNYRLVCTGTHLSSVLLDKSPLTGD